MVRSAPARLFVHLCLQVDRRSNVYMPIKFEKKRLRRATTLVLIDRIRIGASRLIVIRIEAFQRRKALTTSGIRAALRRFRKR